MDPISMRAMPQNWDQLPFEDFLENKLAVISTGEEGEGSGVVVLCIDSPPGFYVAPHKHTAGHIEVVLEGSLYIGEHLEKPGDVRVSPPYESYGPLRTGPEGCKYLEIFPNRQSVIPIVDDPTVAATHFGDDNHLKIQLERMLKL
jgi:hypothetical protein